MGQSRVCSNVSVEIHELGFLKDIFENVCKDFNAELVEMNGERDHVHLLVNYPPNIAPSHCYVLSVPLKR